MLILLLLSLTSSIYSATNEGGELLSIMVDSSDNSFILSELTKTTDYQWRASLQNTESFYKDLDPLSRRMKYAASNAEIKQASVLIESLDTNILHMKITDKNSQRWEVPDFYGEPKDLEPAKLDSMGIEVAAEGETFAFSLTDKNSQKVFDSHGTTFKYFDKYLEFGVSIPSQRIYGIGEHCSPFEMGSTRDESIYTLWNKDSANPYADGGGNRNEYGSQPFFVFQLPNHRVAALFFKNSNAIDYVITKDNQNQKATVTHKSIGGIFDFYFIYAGTMEEMVRKYHSIIGRPYVIPFWSLGWHQCRYGWHTLEVVKEVVEKYDAYDIPLEVIWNDIDYMDEYADFTVSSDRYGGLLEYMNQIHDKGMYYVPIIDAGIKYLTKYYDMFEQQGGNTSSLITSAVTGKTLIGKVWPGYAAFPDFFHPDANAHWREGLKELHAQAPFDGIWIDMNDPSNFCYGECPPTSMAEETTITDGFHDPKEFDNLPFVPGGNLNDKTISVTGYHYATNDYENMYRKQYFTHNFWALQEAKATNEFFELDLKRRPFILSRSNFPGTGRVGSVWLGDNFSQWEYMRYSIAGIFAMQLFGIPLVGADVCGFMGSPNAELCGRWHQLGAFYPFSRNHDDIHSPDQYPWLFGDNVLEGTKKAIRQKYAILRYYYTLLFDVSLYGGTMMKPLFFEYPEDEKAYSKTPYELMVGRWLVVSPVLYPNNHATYPYLPNGNWWDFRTYENVLSYSPGGAGKDLNVPCELQDEVVVHIRGGGIVTKQETSKVLRTKELLELPMQLIIALDHTGGAYGNMVVDDGVSIDPIANEAYRRYIFMYSSDTLHLATSHTYPHHYTYEIFTQIIILGARKVDYACFSDRGDNKYPVTVSYDDSKQILTLTSDKNMYWDDIKFVQIGLNCGKP